MGKSEKNRDRHVGRLWSLGGVFPLLMLLVLARSFWFQVVKPEKWLVMAGEQYEQRELLPARRGVVYDRHMNILAMDLPGSSLAVDPSQVQDRDAMVETLAAVLNGDKEAYSQMLFSNSRSEYVHLSRAIQPHQKAALESAGLKGFIFDSALSRVRPGEALAIELVGGTGVDRVGSWGVELSMNKWLMGRDGWTIEQKDAYNRRHSSLDYHGEKPIAGNHVILTIDHVLQTVVEEELKNSVLRHKAKYGCAVLLDPYTGEVLAMANQTGHESRTGDISFNEKIQNRIVQWSYEPGSTFKVVTLAAALERGGYSPDSLVFCENGSYRLGTHELNDHEESFGWLTLSGVIEESSNIGVAKIGMGLGSKVMYEYARNFGFGNKTGIQLPGESAGLLRPVYQWQKYSPAFISYGQEISATPLQVAGMIAAIANGGELVRPRIVKEIQNGSGNVIKSFERQVIRRVVTQRTASRVSAILERVVMKGSGDEAAVPGIRVAGKTGTAQKSVEGHLGYLPNTRVASFAGYWPADSPRYAMVVVLDEPTYKYWGSHSAAPLFGRIVNRIEGIPEPAEENALAQTDDQFVFASMSVSSETADRQDGAEQRNQSIGGHAVPKLTGLSMRQAMHRLSGLGITVSMKGHGVVVKQSPAPGTPVSEDLVCVIEGQSMPEELE